MTNNKLVIRRLPPSMTEDEFLETVGPLPDHDYFCFFEALPGLGCHSYNRAYINFLNSDDMQTFRDRFDNHIFLDKNGREYSAVVEQSLWHKSATSGPFYKGSQSEFTREASSDLKSRLETASSSTIACGGLEADPDFVKFVEQSNSLKQTTKGYPRELKDSKLEESPAAGDSISDTPNKDNQKVTTPLLNYVNNIRVMKNRRRGR